MASSHSLQASGSTTRTASKKPTHLPLPSSNKSLNVVPGGPAPRSPTHNPHGEYKPEDRAPSPTSRPRNYQEPSSPTLRSHPSLQRAHVSGVQPSSSFFHPARPRPPSTVSSSSSHGEHDQDGDGELFKLSPLTAHHDGDESELDGPETTEDLDHRGSPEKNRGPKYSREPLLPFGGNPAQRRPTINTDAARRNSGAPHPFAAHSSPVAPTPSSTSRQRVRTSIDRVLGRVSHDTRSRASVHFAQNGPNSEESGRHLKVRSSHSPALSPSRGEFPKSPHFIATRPDELPTHVDPHGTRVYQTHPARNRFFLQGRLLTGGDAPWPAILSFCVLLAVAGTWFGGPVVWWWGRPGGGRAVAAVGIYMTLVTISTMLTTAFTDPGILPRELDPDPPYPSASSSDGDVPRAPLPRDIKVRRSSVLVKYCPTCRTYRPPRSSHCKMCDNCVDGCDHHCQWLNNCIGRRNYTTFISFLITAVLTLCLVIVTSAVQFKIMSESSPSFAHTLGDAPVSAVSFVLAILVVGPVGVLFSYHLRLLVLNITTIEQIRNQAHKTLVPGEVPKNPFSHGSWRRNFVSTLCRPQGYSWLDARAPIVQDRREINPGLVKGGSWGGEY